MNAQLPLPEMVEQRFQGFQWLNAGVLFISRALDVTVCNELAVNYLDAAPPVGQPCALELCLSPSGEVYRTLVDLVSFRQEPKDTVMLWEIHGHVRHVLIDSYSCKDAKGNLIGLYLILKDLGNMVALEHHMLRTDKLATVGKIAAGIAHEIRNPLTTLRGFLQVFQACFSDDPEHGHLLSQTHVMLQEVDRINGLVGELLMLSKPRQMEKKPCALATLFEQLNPIIESESLLKNVDYHFELTSDETVMIDSAMIKQVILNLVKNALEAMETHGKLTICVNLAEPWVVIDVMDTGPGIPYYQVDKIFDAFFTTKEKGTGLGLPICQSIISNHGGEIRVASKGFGTTFSICLPYVSQAMDHPW